MKRKPGRPKQPDSSKVVWKGMKPIEFKGRLTVVRFLKDGSLQLLLTVFPAEDR